MPLGASWQEPQGQYSDAEVVMVRLLLLEDVRKLGHVGDVVEVRPGYARNYLMPRRLATEPTEENMKAIEEKRKASAAARAKQLREFEDLATRLVDVSVTIERAANPEGTLYGSVQDRDIADALHAQGFAVRPEHIVLDKPIRTLDNRVVKLEFTDEVSAQVKVWVVREGATADADSESADTGESAPAEPAEES